MKYKREYSIVTKLSKEQVLSRIQKVTHAYDNGDDRFDFEGKITGDTFKLYQLFDYDSNNQIRPEINGVVKKRNEGSLIELSIKLSSDIKLVFILVLFVNFIFIPLEITIWRNIIPEIGWMLHIGSIVVFYVMSLLVFYNKVDKCTNVLSSLVVGELYADKSFWQQGI